MRPDSKPDQWKLYAAHILDAAARIRLYTDMQAENFLMGGLVYDAVLRNLQTLAESAANLSDNIKEKFPAINWRRIKNFRNILVHEYLYGIDRAQVWNVIAVFLPELELAMRSLLPDYQPNLPHSSEK